MVAGLAGWLIMMLTRRSRWDKEFAHDVAEARWVVDHLVPAATDRSLPAAQVSEQWLDGKRRLDDLQSDLYRLGTAAPNSERAARLGSVSGALAALQESLQSDVALRSAAPTAAAPDAEADGARELDASFQQVTHRRDTLIAVLEGRTPGAAHAAP